MIISEIRSLRWADFFLYALVDSRALYRQINKNDPKSFVLSFTVPAVIAVIIIITISLFGRETTFFYYKITYGWILLFLFLSLIIIINSSLMDLISQFLGFIGNIKELVSLINFSLFPIVFFLPVVYFFKVFNFAPAFFFLFFLFGLFIWSALIAIQGISEMYKIGFGKSVLIFIFPFILVGTILLFIFILFIICGVGYIVG